MRQKTTIPAIFGTTDVDVGVGVGVGVGTAFSHVRLYFCPMVVRCKARVRNRVAKKFFGSEIRNIFDSLEDSGAAKVSFLFVFGGNSGEASGANSINLKYGRNYRSVKFNGTGPS